MTGGVYRCPKCGGNSVRVVATTVIDLYDGEEEAPMGAGAEYDDHSSASCLSQNLVKGDDGEEYSCEFVGVLGDFDITDGDPNVDCGHCVDPSDRCIDVSDRNCAPRA